MRWLKPSVFLLCSLPLLWLVWSGLHGGLGANPIEAAMHELGHWALRLLLLGLALNILSRHSGWRRPMQLRRMLGLFAFAYALLHLLVYITLDQFFDLPAILEDLRFRPYILIGLSAWLILLAMAITSTRHWQRRLGRRWARLHRLVYVAVPLAITHNFMVAKTISPEAMVYTALFIPLLILRLLPRRA
ncbi:MAG: sulfoxide reductase heme-binding subunit YedZ [Chromatiales bacterium]|nr:sulfoxide reductase heme-binding subunit YedZ [Gammaproteobacteria bacterium]MBW6476462.1 sulfoxide reductase heme-binding subunit YedZ [Chromatiales bacterium]